MKEEYISIETLRVYSEIEKENKELQEENKKLYELLEEKYHSGNTPKIIDMFHQLDKATIEELQDTIKDRDENIYALETTLEDLHKEIETLKKQLEYLRSGEYLNQVKWERDYNEKVVGELSNRIDKAKEFIIVGSGWTKLTTHQEKKLLNILEGDDKK